MATTARLTIEQFDQLPERADVRYELDEGELVAVPNPNYGHQYVKTALASALFAYLKQSPDLGVALVELEFRLDDATVRRPDVCVIRAAGREPFDVTRSRFDGAPDLAVEVVSPSDTYTEMLRKVQQYLKAGSRAVWVLTPGLRQVETFGAVRATLGPDDDLSDPELLPGFSVRVNSLFPPA